MRPDDSPARVLEPISRKDDRFDAYQQSLMATSYKNGLFNMSSLAQDVNRKLEEKMTALPYGENLWDKYDEREINDLLRQGYAAASAARVEARKGTVMGLIDRPNAWQSDAEITSFVDTKVHIDARDGHYSNIYDNHLKAYKPPSVRKMAQVSRALVVSAPAPVPVPVPTPVAVVNDAPVAISAAARAAAYGDRAAKEPEPKKKKSNKPSKNKDKDKGAPAETAADWME
jgi:hypothetical protein